MVSRFATHCLFERVVEKAVQGSRDKFRGKPIKVLFCFMSMLVKRLGAIFGEQAYPSRLKNLSASSRFPSPAFIPATG